MSAGDALAAGAVATAAAIRSGSIDAERAVSLRIERIAAVDPEIRAVAVPRFESALEDARAADRRRRADESPGPLHGVPFSVKEMIAVAGMPSTIGSWPLRDRVAHRDATVVARLKEAGAVLLCSTNLSEMALWTESANPIYGRTRNPHDRGRSAGGSSGGEAAIVACGGSAFGIGSDGGGSLRLPAHHVGVLAHKPSSGLVPRTGHFPLGEDDPDYGLDDRCITIGPVTRTASDLLPILRVLAGPDGRDPAVVLPPDLPEAPPTDWRGRTVLVLDDPRVRLARRASPAHRAAVKRAAAVFSALGADVRPWSHPELRRALRIWCAALIGDDCAPFRAIFGGGEKLNVRRELLRWARGGKHHMLPSLLLCLAEPLLRPRPARAPWLESARTLRAALERELGDGGVLLMPTVPRVAERHGLPLLFPFDFAFSAIWNALELPATAVPAGRGAHAMPVGIQVVGAHRADARCIGAAVTLEAAGFVAVTPSLR